MHKGRFANYSIITDLTSAFSYLYIATGNIGVNEHSQSLQSTWGKILRINADGSIPNDNPFYNNVDGTFKD